MTYLILKEIKIMTNYNLKLAIYPLLKTLYFWGGMKKGSKDIQ